MQPFKKAFTTQEQLNKDAFSGLLLGYFVKIKNDCYEYWVVFGILPLIELSSITCISHQSLLQAIKQNGLSFLRAQNCYNGWDFHESVFLNLCTAVSTDILAGHVHQISFV